MIIIPVIINNWILGIISQLCIMYIHLNITVLYLQIK